MLNKSQSIPIGAFFFWLIYTLPFETYGTALCGTTAGIVMVYCAKPGCLGKQPLIWFAK